MNSPKFHVPILTTEVIRYLITNKSGTYIDCTIGGGGHSLAILETLNKDGKLIGIDVDHEAVAFSKKRLAKFGNQVIIKQGNFSQLAKILSDENISQVDGILFDLGVSSHQIDQKSRGFSYRIAGPLDMRMNTKQKLTAEQIVNEYDENKLANIFKKFGEERHAKQIARAICQERRKSNISDTLQLANLIVKTVPYKNRIKTLSRIFQALRIYTNKELSNLKLALIQSIPLLKKSSRLVVISYHSLEDRIVKKFFHDQENPCSCPADIPTCICGKKPILKILTKRVIKPAQDEINLNPRSRSARLRAAEKLSWHEKNGIR